MTAGATPSILTKGFFWFLFCTQREARGERREGLKEFKWFKGSKVQWVQGFCFVLSVFPPS